MLLVFGDETKVPEGFPTLRHSRLPYCEVLGNSMDWYGSCTVMGLNIPWP